MINDCITLVHSGDRNNHLWEYWKYYFDMYWDFSRMNVIFLSENKTIDYNKVITKTTGNVSWSKGLKTELNNINSKYIIYMHEDYFLTAKVDFDVLEEILTHMRKRNIKLVKCCGKTGGYSSAYSDFKPTDMKVGDKYLQKYSNKTDYLISHQPSIWNKKFFNSTLKWEESPWSHEINGTIRLRRRNIPVYVYSSNEDEPNTYPIPYKEVYGKGKIRKKCQKYFEINI